MPPARVFPIAVQIKKGLFDIQESFEAQIDKLRNLDYTILDVKTSRWHDDYNSFKEVVKDLEVLGQGCACRLGNLKVFPTGKKHQRDDRAILL